MVQAEEAVLALVGGCPLNNVNFSSFTLCVYKTLALSTRENGSLAFASGIPSRFLRPLALT